MAIQYLRPPGLRPVWIGPRPPLSETQGAIPRWWCARCGAEVFEETGERCFRCQKEELKNVCEKL